MTVEQYLKADRASELRNEYYAGEMRTIRSGTIWHALIAGNLVCGLGGTLKKTPFLVTSFGPRLFVPKTGIYTYSDVVVCSKPQYLDEHRDMILNPTLLIEVLSPSTEAYDRGLKFAQYRTLESLQEYALVSQHEARVEIFRRQSSGWLLSETTGLEASCHFAGVDCTLSLADIYDNVSFEDGEPER